MRNVYTIKVFLRSVGKIFGIIKILLHLCTQKTQRSMNLKTKIGILLGAGIAYILLNRSKTLADELEKLRNQGVVDYTDIINYIDDKTKRPEDVITSNIQIKPYLDFGELDGDKWSVRMRWELKNNSNTYTYVVTGIKSIVSIMGYTCKFWAPGNDTNFVTLSPGATAEIRSEKDIIMLYDDKSVREKIISNYVPETWKGNTSIINSSHIATDYKEGLEAATYLRVQSVYGSSTVVSYGNIAGQIRKLYKKNGWAAVYFNNKEGRNMIGEDL